MQKKSHTFPEMGEPVPAPQQAVSHGELVGYQPSSRPANHPFAPENRRIRRRDARRLNERSKPHELLASELPSLIETHLRHFESGNFSPRTAQKKKEFLSWFVRYMNLKAHEVVGVEELRAFFIFLKNGHLEPGGRWNRSGQKSGPLRPSTINTYYRVLSAFFAWLVKEGRLSVNPLAKIDEPKVPRDQIEPLSQEQCVALLRAVERSKDRARNRAIVLLLLDTGIRASELCGLRLSDVDWDSSCLRVVGKGNKKRGVPVPAP